MPYRIALIDNEPAFLSRLVHLVQQITKQQSFPCTVHCFTSSFAIDALTYDAYLLDIEMDRLNGMELAKRLRSNGDMLPIVFITGYSDYIAEGYDVEALHYLLKPVAKEKLFAVLDKYVEKRSVKADELIIETANGAAHISADRITYIEAFGRKTAVHLSDDRIIDCMVSISRFSAMRLNGFVSPHRSYIVNLRFVRSIGKTEIALDNGTIIPLSRRLYKDVNEKFIQFYTKG